MMGAAEAIAPLERRTGQVRLDGVWTAETAGPHGWDNAGTLVLEGGHVRGGGNSYYARGTYGLTTQGVEMLLTIRFYGITRTVLGECHEEIAVRLRGSRQKNVMYGRMTREDKPRYSVAVRAIKETSLTRDTRRRSSPIIPFDRRIDHSTPVTDGGTR